jgi:methylmalonyl-CoA mutase
VYETLFEKTKGGDMVGLLAENASASDDLKTWTITLRKGIKFHDGTDFNAAAVKTNLDIAGGAYSASVAGAEAATDTRVAHATKLYTALVSAASQTNPIGGATGKLLLAGLGVPAAATAKQARIDGEEDIIVGVNRYQLAKEEPIETLEINNDSVRIQQVEQLNKLKTERNTTLVQESLLAIEKIAQTGEGNLLEAAIVCARNRATLGEISDALERVFGRYQAKIHSIQGVYAKGVMKNEDFKKAIALADKFAHLEGRRPRIMVAKMGQDGHDRGAKIIATSFADMGFDVDISPLFQTPQEVAKQAIENDVHILGISSLAAGHKTLIPAVIEELKSLGRADIMVIAGGVIPAKDYDFLYEKGVFGVFGPGTKIPTAAISILELLIKSVE